VSDAPSTKPPDSAIAGGVSIAHLAIPLTVGVVGHRDLADVDRLAETVREFLSGLRKRHPDTPIQILTALAEGADQLVAKVALEMGLNFVAALPMARDLYEQEFDDEGRSELDRLLRASLEWFELPALAAATREEIARPGDVRNRHYVQVGAFIVRRSQILMALWDGLPGQGEGGTQDIVSFKRRGVPEPYIPKRGPLDVADTGPVHWIVSRRRGASEPAGAKAGTLDVLPPEGDVKEDHRGEGGYVEVGAKINELNRAAARFCDPDTVASSIRYLIGEEADSGRPKGLSPGLERIAGAYAAADIVAMNFQKSSAFITALIFGLGASMVVTFGLYSSVLEADWPLLGLYLALFIGVAAVYWLSDARENYNSFLDARALAEALRVQFFWRATGSWEGVAHHYLRHQAEELRWIRDALRSLELVAPVRSNTSQQLEWARAWMRGQSDYFTGSAAARQLRLHRIQQYALTLYGAGLAISLLELVSSACGLLGSQGGVTNWALMLMGLAPAFAALGTGYAEFMSFEEDVKRHERMKSLFALASARLEQIKIPEASAEGQLRELMHDLGSEALRENADWLLLHRRHQPKPSFT
jgi:hypothetical protein